MLVRDHNLLLDLIYLIKNDEKQFRQKRQNFVIEQTSVIYGLLFDKND